MRKIVLPIVGVFLSLCLSISLAYGELYSIEVKNFSSHDSKPGFCGFWHNPEGKKFFGLFNDSFAVEKALEPLQALHFEGQKVVFKEKPSNIEFIPCYRRISLSDLGYREPLFIRGTKGAFYISVPWSPAFSLRGSKILLYVKYPRGIFNNQSSITVSVEGVPLKFFKINDISALPLEVELDPQELKDIPIKESLDITINTNLSITEDRCVDEQTGNMWLYIDPQSYIELTQNKFPENYWEVLKIPPGKINIVPNPDVLKETVLPASIATFSSLLGSLSFSDEKSKITVNDYALEATNVIIRNYERDMEIIGHDLYVSLKGLKNLALLKKHFPASFSSFKISEGSFYNKSKESERLVSLGRLGIKPSLMKGVGDLVFSIPFSLASFEGFPERLLFNLLFTKATVSGDDKALLKLRLNGVLIASKALGGGSGEEDFSALIPTKLLQTRNVLELVFSYYLNRGDCKGSIPEMEVSVSPESYFSAVKPSSRISVLSFDSAPGLLAGKGGLILGDPFDSSFLEISAKMARKLGYIRGDSLDLEMVNMEEFSKDEAHDFYIVIIKPSQAEFFKPPVSTSQGTIRVLNSQTMEIFAELHTEDRLALLQVYYEKGVKPVIMLIVSDLEKRDVAAMLDDIKLDGPANVALYTRSGAAMTTSVWQKFEVGEKMSVSYPAKKGFGYYWLRYKIYAFIVMGIFLLAFIIYVYKKLS